MNETDKARVIAAYNARIDEHGATPEALGWARRRHNVRFAVFAEMLPLDGCSMMDFGCGMADFLGFVRDRGHDVQYTGIDINPRLIEVGQQRYPDAELMVADILATPLQRRFDFAVASGVHNVKIADNDAFLRGSLDALWDCADRAVALNFLSDRVAWRTEDSHHHDPCAVLALCYEKTNKVVLRNDYMPFEFTVVLYKDDAFDRQHVVYPEYAHLVDGE